MNIVVIFIGVTYIFYTPFTKVEESFNVQAMHDLLYHRFNLSQYDHNEFPGVVPRTFLGPIFISLTVSPLIALMNFLDVNKFWSQYIVRICLAGFVVYSWNLLKKTFQQKLGMDVGVWYTLITITQFHFMFYMSRPLPNVMALPLVLLAVNSWLRRENKRFLAFSGAAIIIFRAELVILLGLFLLYDIFHQRVTVKELIKTGSSIGIGLILLTIIVDSIFWGRLLWPEMEVFWFNTILNKSAEWGTNPFFWYFYSALPRAMGLSLLLVPFGVVLEPRIRAIAVPAIMFVLIYSILPHKELRFIIYVFPLLNIAAACTCHRIWINRHKSMIRLLLSFAAAGHLIGNFILTVFLLTVSGTNYPGGVAMSRLHRLALPEQNITVHIDNLSAQSGVSRFTQIHTNWTYSKDEHLKAGDEELHRFDFLMTEVRNKYSPEMKLYEQTHQKVELIDCFSNIGLHYESLLPIKIRTKPCIMILRKKKDGLLLKNLVYDETIVVEEPESETEEEELDLVEEEQEEELQLENTEEASADEDYVETPESVVENTEEEKDEEQQEELPKLKKIRKRKLLKTVENPKQKIKEIIEAESKILNEIAENVEEKEKPKEIKEPVQQPKSNIKKIIKEERTREFIEELSKMDLSKFCDLDKMDTKDCLKKIIEEKEII